jgi:hypothetical protein
MRIAALRYELAQRDAVLATREVELTEAASIKAKLKATLLEIIDIPIIDATQYGKSMPASLTMVVDI